MAKKILFITLSNIGDVILTLPVLDCLKINYPEAKITVICGERPKEIFQNNPAIHKVIVYHKQLGLKEKINLFFALGKESFDLVVDLRNSFFGVFLPAKKRISSFLLIPGEIKHMRQRHLYKIKNQISNIKNFINAQNESLYIKLQDKEYVKNIFEQNNIKESDTIIVIAPGARSHIKRWDKDKFSGLSCQLAADGLRVVLVGDASDLPIAEYIQKKCPDKVLNLCAKTNISQLAALLEKSKLLITNDSALLHLASYLNIPLAAIFGPTNEFKYGPWSDRCAVIKKEIFCRPCEKAQCRFGTLDCMRLIKVGDVFKQVKKILENSPPWPDTLAGQGEQRTENRNTQDKFKRILVVRTDRIGDVLLSTPVIKALRNNYPDAYIAMMVSPYAKDIAEGNPYLDEVIIYDKDGKHQTWSRSMKFALNLKKKKFDLAIVLHPTNRVHLVTFFAGICRRVGYGRKLGFLLTDRLKHTKQLGQKHELEYNLDLLHYLGIEAEDKDLFMPIKEESERWLQALFMREEIQSTDKLLAIHPGASCPSKIWPEERFAQVVDRLVEKYGFKVLLIAGPKDMARAEKVLKDMHQPPVNLAGKISLSQLASLLKRCRLFISNDSGPVHIASAVGTPVVSIFGRNQAGLSPKRWGPRGEKDQFLHKPVGCIQCLAHNCVREFACLKAITVDDVLKIAESVLQEE